ncbi:hypothetical protein [Actinacidiphila yanglinensis]|uniref:hypothetical protein n=1 Tax=Actinacidiphila yanglinensis TaxID=310779 RepID=UPI0011B0EFB0|nr:hypothetical protein [Actinacidiphila yanglinensis]
MTQPDIFGPGTEWLPELRTLLEAYRSVPVPAEECFVDTEDTPSRGMSSYLRVAVYYPLRCFRATREIMEVVHLGVEHWDVSAAFARMPPLIPPRGRIRVECLMMMVPYLAAFENEGYRVAPAPPDTHWEWRERFPNLQRLLSRGGLDPASAVPDRNAGAPSAPLEDFRIAAARRELDEVRGLWPAGATEAEWAAAVHGLRASGLPDGTSVPEWLAQLDADAAAHLDAAGYRLPAAPDPAYPAHDIRALW